VVRTPTALRCDFDLLWANSLRQHDTPLIGLGALYAQLLALGARFHLRHRRRHLAQQRIALADPSTPQTARDG
jgi:hypothetical protein